MYAYVTKHYIQQIRDKAVPRALTGVFTQVDRYMVKVGDDLRQAKRTTLMANS